MIFEDSRLHQCLEPWQSDSKSRGALGILGGMFGMSIGLVLVLSGNLSYPDDLIIMVFAYVFFIFIGFIYLLVGLFAFLDRKDNWKLTLPYNFLLFEQVDEKILALFQESGYKYFRNQEMTIRHVEKDLRGAPLGKSYTIMSGSENDIEFEFGLNTHTNKSLVYYNFIIHINNIKKDNVEFATEFHLDVHAILEDLEYKKFKEVRKI